MRLRVIHADMFLKIWELVNQKLNQTWTASFLTALMRIL